MDLEPLPPSSPWSEGPAPDWQPAPPRRHWSLRTRITAAVAGVATVGLGAFAISALAGGGAVGLAATTAAAPATPSPARQIHGAAFGTASNVNGAKFTVTNMFAATTEITQVATDASTQFTRTFKGVLSDLKVGDTVAAQGTRGSDGTLTASWIVQIPTGLLGQAGGNGAGGKGAGGRFVVPRGAAPTAPATPNAPGANTAPAPPKMRALPVTLGTIKSIANGVLTLTSRQGSTETVSTSSSTNVIETATAAMSAVTNGADVVVLGTPTTDGKTLTAARVEVIDQSVESLMGNGAKIGLGLLGPMFGGGRAAMGGALGGLLGGLGKALGGFVHGFGGGQSAPAPNVAPAQ
jgi:hypothetical protein